MIATADIHTTRKCRKIIVALCVVSKLCISNWKVRPGENNALLRDQSMTVKFVYTRRHLLTSEIPIIASAG